MMAPLLKIREQKAERLMQETMQRVMTAMMGGDDGYAPSGAQMEQAVGDARG